MAAGTHGAEVYKCTDAEGKLSFSQQPCEAKAAAEVLQIESRSSGIDFVAEGDFAKIEAENAARAQRRQRDHNIALHQRNITLLRHERDTQITRLRQAQSQARNNAAGAAYRNSLETQMQTITQEYRARITTQQDAINRLREP
jgi:hypothetical protein